MQIAHVTLHDIHAIEYLFYSGSEFTKQQSKTFPLEKTNIADYIILSVRSKGWIGLIVCMLEHQGAHRRALADAHNKVAHQASWNSCLTIKRCHHTAFCLDGKEGGRRHLFQGFLDLCT